MPNPYALRSEHLVGKLLEKVAAIPTIAIVAKCSIKKMKT
jgi:hypothetical protein